MISRFPFKLTCYNPYANKISVKYCTSLEHAHEVARSTSMCVSYEVLDRVTGSTHRWDWDPESADEPIARWDLAIIEHESGRYEIVEDDARTRAITKIKTLLTDEERKALFGDTELKWING